MAISVTDNTDLQTNQAIKHTMETFQNTIDFRMPADNQVVTESVNKNSANNRIDSQIPDYIRDL